MSSTLHLETTLDLQLPTELKLLLSPSLRRWGLRFCRAVVIDAIANEKWKYTAIARYTPKKSNHQNVLVPGYALIYSSEQFLSDKANIHAARGIIALFADFSVILFSNLSRDLAPCIERLLEDEGKLQHITIGVVKQGHIDELRDTKDRDLRRTLIVRNLRLLQVLPSWHGQR